MKAITFEPGTKRIRLSERPEPGISAPDEVKLRVVRVGICGTDREKIAISSMHPPSGMKDIVIGHEMMGQVVETGRDVTAVAEGDYAAIVIRRPCGKCAPCTMNRPDMCRTGGYRDRGLAGIDGFQAEFVVDKEKNVVRIPREIEPVGVFVEPLSVVEKALDEAVRLQTARLPDAPEPDWFWGKKCLVAGLGSIGLLASLALRLREAEVFGLDVFDRENPRARWLEGLGGRYIDGRGVKPEDLDEKIGEMDIVFEAAGVAGLAFKLIDALAKNGAYILTGLPMRDNVVEVPGRELIDQLVHGNQIMVGSVGSAISHFRMAVDDLMLANLRWGDHLSKLITGRIPFNGDISPAFGEHREDEIKTVIEWARVA